MDLLGLDGLEGLYKDTLPVVSISASQSLNASAGRDSIATGLPHLDAALAVDQQPGGILRGHVTEIFGPPGAGKTSLAANLAAFDCSLNATTDGVPPPGTNLIVIDSVSSFFTSYFPTAAELKEELAEGKLVDKAHLQWLLGRKPNIANDLGTHLARLAAKNIAVLAINQSQTKIKEEREATLLPVLAGGAWEKTVQTRLAVYRALPDDRFVEIEKLSGKPLPEPDELAFAFHIDSNGLRERDCHISGSVKHPERSPEFEYYDPPTPTPSPLSSVLSSPPPSPELLSPKLDVAGQGFSAQESPIKKSCAENSSLSPALRPASPQQAAQTPNKKRKVQEVADSQDEASDDEAPWTDEATLNTNQS
ncbi:DNA recombination and repair protein Rad51 C-terminal [Penicillium brevicompactum]|uniref:DNA recombination and repair protein Rad51 C-terminal n=1 Tax=Penicillium brevicompactum TaxID=5074 RepID=A0A9W9QSA7_PENBR|nr:DNA recombination and repair protein Rad51 C-terminal [Penicillium brevicompactum]